MFAKNQKNTQYKLPPKNNKNEKFLIEALRILKKELLNADMSGAMISQILPDKESLFNLETIKNSLTSTYGNYANKFIKIIDKTDEKVKNNKDISKVNKINHNLYQPFKAHNLYIAEISEWHSNCLAAAVAVFIANNFNALEVESKNKIAGEFGKFIGINDFTSDQFKKILDGTNNQDIEILIGNFIRYTAINSGADLEDGMFDEVALFFVRNIFSFRAYSFSKDMPPGINFTNNIVEPTCLIYHHSNNDGNFPKNHFSLLMSKNNANIHNNKKRSNPLSFLDLDIDGNIDNDIGRKIFVSDAIQKLEESNLINKKFNNKFNFLSNLNNLNEIKFENLDESLNNSFYEPITLIDPVYYEFFVDPTRVAITTENAKTGKKKNVFDTPLNKETCEERYSPHKVEYKRYLEDLEAFYNKILDKEPKPPSIVEVTTGKTLQHVTKIEFFEDKKKTHQVKQYKLFIKNIESLLGEINVSIEGIADKSLFLLRNAILEISCDEDIDSLSTSKKISKFNKDFPKILKSISEQKEIVNNIRLFVNRVENNDGNSSKSLNAQELNIAPPLRCALKRQNVNIIQMNDLLLEKQSEFVQGLSELLNDQKYEIGLVFKSLPRGAHKIKAKLDELYEKGLKNITQLDYAELCNTILVNAYDAPLDAFRRQNISSDYSKHKSRLRSVGTEELYRKIIEKLNASYSNNNNKTSPSSSSDLISEELLKSNESNKLDQQKTSNPMIHNLMRVGHFRQLYENIGEDFTQEDFHDILYSDLKP